MDVETKGKRQRKSSLLRNECQAKRKTRIDVRTVIFFVQRLLSFQFFLFHVTLLFQVLGHQSPTTHKTKSPLLHSPIYPSLTGQLQNRTSLSLSLFIAHNTPVYQATSQENSISPLCTQTFQSRFSHSFLLIFLWQFFFSIPLSLLLIRFSVSASTMEEREMREQNIAYSEMQVFSDPTREGEKDMQTLFLSLVRDTQPHIHGSEL